MFARMSIMKSCNIKYNIVIAVFDSIVWALKAIRHPLVDPMVSEVELNQSRAHLGTRQSLGDPGDLGIRGDDSPGCITRRNGTGRAGAKPPEV